MLKSAIACVAARFWARRLTNGVRPQRSRSSEPATTSSSRVKVGKRACWRRSSGTKTTPARIASWGPPKEWRSPSIQSSPPSALEAPASSRARALRPLPASPQRPTISPSRRVKLEASRPGPRRPSARTSGRRWEAGIVCGLGLASSGPAISSTRRERSNSAVAPSAITSPSRMATMRSLIALISSSRWET